MGICQEKNWSEEKKIRTVRNKPKQKLFNTKVLFLVRANNILVDNCAEKPIPLTFTYISTFLLSNDMLFV